MDTCAELFLPAACDLENMTIVARYASPSLSWLFKRPD